ncbi:coiled-coil domain-containing protein 152 [Cygnus atratus]|uniref:coiled-coil domain-containing protein 152 n=1 Tax=Cygnus atratus TaxID=8868 RepID=UPI0021B80C89|nr:coiled-coil domain-containing protein 152 [Cygnus atratus]
MAESKGELPPKGLCQPGPELDRICPPKIQSSSSADCPRCFSKDRELYHLVIAVPTTASNHHINHKTFPVNKIQVKWDTLPSRFPHHLHQEVTIHTFRKSPSLLLLHVIIFPGILFDGKLNMTQQDVLADKRASCTLGCIKHSTASRSREGIVLLCSVLLQPHLQYCVSFGSHNKISEISEANNLLVLQLEKSNRLLSLSQSKEESVKEECTALQNVIKGLTQTLENHCNVKDENGRLKENIHILEEKLKACEQEYKDQIEKLMIEIQNKEEAHKLEITRLNCNIRKKSEAQEVEFREQIEKKELEILELTRQLKTQDEEKQNEIIKLQIEFNAKLARVQNKTTKSFSDASVLPQSIYRRKLQHLQEEKNKEIEVLRNTIRDLEQRLNKVQDLHFKRRRF